jgi:DNA (cytosine-5)-methyltransferase 1
MIQGAPTAIDLFCGAGGLSLGLSRAGFRLVAGVDNWDAAAQTYSRNFSHPFLRADLAVTAPESLMRSVGVEPGEIDLVAGAPPCAGFSVQRIGSDEDVRNDLVLRFAEHVIHAAPRMYFMENVPGLLGKRGLAVSQRFELMLREAGYETMSLVVNAADYGVPQNRRRALLWGWRKHDLPRFDLPSRTHVGRAVTVHEVIGDLPSPPDDHSPAPDDVLHRRTRLSATNLERLRLIPPGGGFEDLPAELRVDCHKNGAEKIGHRYVYGRLAPDRPAGTITARFDSFTRGRFGHPSEHRNITLREGARLQTFPDDFCFAGTQEVIATLIGNAVPPVLAEAAGRALRDHLSQPASTLRASASSDPGTLFDVGSAAVRAD